MNRLIKRILVVALLLAVPTTWANSAEQVSKLHIAIDDIHGNPLPCRVHLLNEMGKAVEIEGLPFWRDHFVCPGRAEAMLPPGEYHYTIERGPEYQRHSGKLKIEAGKEGHFAVILHRRANLREKGWYSGDLHVHRPVEDVPLLMQAEDLDFAPVITWWNTRNTWKDAEIPAPITRQFDGQRIYSIMAGEDEREGGALLYFGLRLPLDIATKDREFPSPMQYVNQARAQADVWIDIEKPFWWDVPVWLASGNMNSIGIANNHMCRSSMYLDEAWGKPRDNKRLPNPHGNGYWTQEIYYHLLNTGLRIPPSAGSASGVLPNPVGYNRVYVHLDEPFSRDAWFRGLAAGRSFLTNGPLLLVTANDAHPGTTFKASPREKKTIRLDIDLRSQDPIAQLEIVHNGKVKEIVAVPNPVTSMQLSHELTIDSPGWFLVRAITDVKQTFRFATTAPWFVEYEGVQPRISRSSSQFFLDWVEERIALVTENVTDESHRTSVLKWHHQAQQFWQQRLANANAD